MKKIYNFSAGPSALPEWVLARAKEDLPVYKESGQSVMEMSHRGEDFLTILEEAKERLRTLLKIPPEYHILFLQGGASSQFAMVPMNLLTKGKQADYILTGVWAEKACQEASRFGKVHIAGSSREEKYAFIPSQEELSLTPDASYLHITYNNTIVGTKFPYIPVTKAPIVADVSSCLLSEPIDVSKFGILYAGAQKNIGIAGLTLVIIRDDLVGEALSCTPTVLRYQTHVQAGSLYHTPPCYAIYICNLVLRWLQEQIGGLEKMQKINREKAAILYEALERSRLFDSPVKKGSRSLMNLPFTLKRPELQQPFLEEANRQGLINLKGHRLVGGMRASIYNAMPLEGVRKLAEFLNDFEKNFAAKGGSICKR